MSEARLRKLAANWEGLAASDPLWAICTDPSRRQGAWDVGEFFASGKTEVDKVLGCLGEIGLSPDAGKTALDFGCGVGRLTQSLAGHFQRCVGVDISPTMIELANRFNRHPERCTYAVNDSGHLGRFPDASFGFIYTNIVLQHVGPELAKQYIAEFVRLLDTSGILVFQVPDRFALGPIGRLRRRLMLGTRLRGVLAALGVGQRPYYMEMHCLSESEIRRLLRAHPVRLADVRLTNATDLGYNGRLEYLAVEPSSGAISKQYCVVKG